MKKASAFSGLKLTEQVGLDQRLFAGQPTSEATKQRNNETTETRNNETTPQRNDEATNEPGGEGTSERNNVVAHESTHERSKERARQRSGPARRFAIPGERLADRHSHDIYHDQILWMNRVKLELEEQYGQRVTSNAIVKLALDRLRHDFEAGDDRSEITGRLIGASMSATGDEAPEGGGDAA